MKLLVDLFVAVVGAFVLWPVWMYVMVRVIWAVDVPEHVRWMVVAYIPTAFVFNFMGGIAKAIVADDASE